MDEVAVVHRTSFDDRLPWLAGLHTEEEDQAFFGGPVFDDCKVWGAYDEQGLVGFIAFCEGSVEQLYVLPRSQGQGVGSRLLAIAQRSSSELSLWTFQRNEPARRFYEKRGFVTIEQTDGTRNEEHEPDVLYRWHRQ